MPTETAEGQENRHLPGSVLSASALVTSYISQSLGGPSGGCSITLCFTDTDGEAQRLKQPAQHQALVNSWGFQAPGLPITDLFHIHVPSSHSLPLSELVHRGLKLKIH